MLLFRRSICLVTPRWFTCMSHELKETNISTNVRELGKPFGWLRTYKHGRGLELKNKTLAKWSEWDLNLRPLNLKSGALITQPRSLLHLSLLSARLIRRQLGAWARVLQLIDGCVHFLDSFLVKVCLILQGLNFRWSIIHRTLIIVNTAFGFRLPLIKGAVSQFSPWYFPFTTITYGTLKPTGKVLSR